MRINRLRLRKQQQAIEAANRAETQSVQAAVDELAAVVAEAQAAIVAKATGAPTVQSAINDLRDKVAEVQKEVGAPDGLVAVTPPPPLVTPDKAREIAADLVEDADAAERKP